MAPHPAQEPPAMRKKERFAVELPRQMQVKSGKYVLALALLKGD